MSASAAIRQRFPLGDCRISPGAREHLAEAGVRVGALLARHATGDWGQVCPEDAAENELSLREGFRILSDYPVADEKVWIITEWDRSATTVLLAWEY